ncbi:MAG: hypothetical protein AAGT88_01920 [Dethiobacter sp.]
MPLTHIDGDILTANVRCSLTVTLEEGKNSAVMAILSVLTKVAVRETARVTVGA